MGTPDSIDWSHVAPRFKWMARDENGVVALYEDEPYVDDICDMWTMGEFGCEWHNARNFSSYVRGSCDWKDSLVQRPEGV